MIEMGRPKTGFPDLPPRMTAQRSGSRVYYYHQVAGKKRPLGADKAAALRAWAAIEAGGIGSGFLAVADAYLEHLKPSLSDSSNDHYARALGNLGLTFSKFRLEQIEPHHVKTYIRRRSKKGAALFEKRILSALFNWARGEGLTSAPNPCAGVKFTQAERKAIGRLGKREVYVTDAEFAAVHTAAGPILQDAMDLALLTGQRPSDVLKMSRQDIRDGALWIVQKKTGAKVGIRVEGELKRVVERCLGRPRAIPSMYLVADAKGQRIRLGALQKQFVAARGSATWQFRDIRAKAATDSPDLKAAQGLLGHSIETTTTVYRRRKGTVAPLR